MNPYEAPGSEYPKHRPDDTPGLIRHREFRGRSLLTFSVKKLMQRLRNEAEAFVNNEVGVDNVVTIDEQCGFEHYVIVWYRTG